MLFGKITVPLVDEAFLEEVQHWVGGLRTYLCPTYCLPYLSASCVCMDCDPTTIPSHHDGLYPSVTISENRSFLLCGGLNKNGPL